MANIYMNLKTIKLLVKEEKIQVRVLIPRRFSILEVDKNNNILIFQDFTAKKKGDPNWDANKIKIDDFCKYFSKIKKHEKIFIREPMIVSGIDVEKRELSVKYIEDESIVNIPIPNQFLKMIDSKQENLLPEWLSDESKIPRRELNNACRYVVNIEKIRVERIKDISIEDCRKEGFSGVEEYEKVWDESVPKGYLFKDNPYVFIYDFKFKGRK